MPPMPPAAQGCPTCPERQHASLPCPVPDRAIDGPGQAPSVECDGVLAGGLESAVPGVRGGRDQLEVVCMFLVSVDGDQCDSAVGAARRPGVHAGRPAAGLRRCNAAWERRESGPSRRHAPGRLAACLPPRRGSYSYSRCRRRRGVRRDRSYGDRATGTSRSGRFGCRPMPSANAGSRSLCARRRHR